MIQEIDKSQEQQSEKGYHMLKCWKQNKGTAATYQTLCDALQYELLWRQDLAGKFCYIKGSYFIQYLTWVQWSGETPLPPLHHVPKTKN